MHGSICFTQERMTERRQSGNFTTHNTNKGYQLVVFFVELYGYFGKKTIEKPVKIHHGVLMVNSYRYLAGTNGT